MDVGSQLLHALVQQQDVQDFLRFRLSKEMFYGVEQAIFDFVCGHMDKYHKLPDPATLAEQFTSLPKVSETPAYYLDQVETRHAHKRINKALLDCNALMKEQDAWGALEKIEEVVEHLHSRQMMQSVFDFATAGVQMVTDEIRRIKLAQEEYGIQLGWPTFDNAAGGVHAGDVVSIIGRPAMGKTWFILYIALYIWQVLKKRVLVVSMEMDVLSIAQRLMALVSKVEAKHIRVADLTAVEGTRLSTGSKKLKLLHENLWLMDGNLHAQVDQIFTIVRHLQPHVLLVDGAYLLGHPDSRLDKYKRNDVNIELIKRRSGEHHVTTILSYQFNRQAVKKFKGKKEEGQVGGLEDIAYSDAIGQISSAVLAANQEDTVETAKQRTITVIKCRSGEVDKFNVHWDFKAMDFSEAVPPKASEMQFL